jgi:hypothetical protein
VVRLLLAASSVLAYLSLPGVRSAHYTDEAPIIVVRCADLTPGRDIRTSTEYSQPPKCHDILMSLIGGVMWVAVVHNKYT